MAFHVACPITWYFFHNSLSFFFAASACLFYFTYRIVQIWLIGVSSFSFIRIAAGRFASAYWGFLGIFIAKKAMIRFSMRSILSKTSCESLGMLKFPQKVPFRSMCLSSLFLILVLTFRLEMLVLGMIQRLRLLPHHLFRYNRSVSCCKRRQLRFVLLILVLVT